MACIDEMHVSSKVSRTAVESAGLRHLWKPEGTNAAFGFEPAGCKTFSNFGFSTNFYPRDIRWE